MKNLFKKQEKQRCCEIFYQTGGVAYLTACRVFAEDGFSTERFIPDGMNDG
jgi:hypothetical protein